MGLTQSELAFLVGVTRQTINKIEAGDYNPTVRLALALAEALSTPMDQLFYLEEEEDERS
jgi:putative transcriptional regulator